MRELRRQLEDARVDAHGRRWVYVPYDQLHAGVTGLTDAAAPDVGLLFVESPAKAARRPYHRQKLLWVLASQRHFALEMARRGFAVRYVVADEPATAVRDLAREVGPLTVAEPAERELRRDLAAAITEGALRVVPHQGWLTRDEDMPAGPPFRLDAFYRRVRTRTGWLMDGGKPRGGRWSHDADNREPWRGEPPAPTPPRFEPDALTREVAELIGARFSRHPGRLDPEAVPASVSQVEAAWAWAREACLVHFGPYEDAMSVRSRGLFHTRVSPLLNLHRLWPARVIDDVLAAALPLASQEGLLRQIAGWREFVRHVHLRTDGLRDGAALADVPMGDGGYAAWAGHPWGPSPGDGAGPAAPGAGVPPALWGAQSGLACLDDVVTGVWEDGWSHHITRLMVIGNLATLLDVDARALTDWFWVAYIDAFDWVVEPNVLGMATAATDVMTTKPYVAGAAYLSRMSDACGSCRFRPKVDCPITPLYWAWLARHEARFAHNARMWGPYAGLRKRDPARRAEDARTFEAVRAALARGEVLTPAIGGLWDG